MSSPDESLDALLDRHLAWLHGYVSRRMTPAHRAFEASADVLQDVLTRLVSSYGELLPRDDDEFRALAATVALNRLRDRHDWVHAERRSRKRENPAAFELSALTPADRSTERPSEVASRKEDERTLRLALELIDPDDGQLIRLRQWQELEWSEIGERLETTGDAARMRFTRALVELGRMTKLIREGRFGELDPDSLPA